MDAVVAAAAVVVGGLFFLSFNFCKRFLFPFNIRSYDLVLLFLPLCAVAVLHWCFCFRYHVFIYKKMNYDFVRHNFFFGIISLSF